QAEDGIRDRNVTGVQTCALPIFDDPRDERTRAWVQHHNVHTEEFLKGTGSREELRARVREVVDRDRRGMPKIVGGRCFELRRGEIGRASCRGRVRRWAVGAGWTQ